MTPKRGGGVMDDNLYIQFSRPLEPDEHVCLLRRGAAKRDQFGRVWASEHGWVYDQYPSKGRRRNRWIVYYNASKHDETGLTERIEWPLEYYGQFNRDLIDDKFEWDGGTSDNAFLIKDRVNEDGDGGYAFLMRRKGFGWITCYYDTWWEASIPVGATSMQLLKPQNQGDWPTTADDGACYLGFTFGIAVYKAAKYKTKYGWRALAKVERVSNVAYFRKFCGVFGWDTEQARKEPHTWTYIPQ